MFGGVGRRVLRGLYQAGGGVACDGGVHHVPLLVWCCVASCGVMRRAVALCGAMRRHAVSCVLAFVGVVVLWCCFFVASRLMWCRGVALSWRSWCRGVPRGGFRRVVGVGCCRHGDAAALSARLVLIWVDIAAWCRF